MRRCNQHPQAGMTLIEVLIATLILSVGLLGAAGAQIKALKYVDSALMSTQTSFIAYDMLDRIRANSAGDYRTSALTATHHGISATNVAGQDLNEFKRNIRQFAGDSARGAISVSEQQVTIHLEWDDSRAEGLDGAFQSFTLRSQLLLQHSVPSHEQV